MKDQDGTVLVKQQLPDRLKSIDGVIFDVDGVLLDVTKSFRVVICEAVDLYAEQILEWDVDTPLLLSSETELFKRAGRFNNDWVLTQAAVLLYVFKSLLHGTKQASSLRSLPPSVDEFTKTLSREGGGIDNAEKQVLNECRPSMRRTLSHMWNQRLIIQLCQELYGGVEWCPQLYGFTPTHVHVEGRAESEPVLIDANKLSPRLGEIGILTGRTRAEATLALRRTDLLARIPPQRCITDDDGVHKPDPRALWLLLERMNVRSVVYVGDTLDDLSTVTNYAEWKQSSYPEVFSAMVLTGMGGERNRQLYLERGADILAPNVNGLLDYLSSATGQSK